MAPSRYFASLTAASYTLPIDTRRRYVRLSSSWPGGTPIVSLWIWPLIHRMKALVYHAGWKNGRPPTKPPPRSMSDDDVP
jgi:hypothetical protein